MCRNLYCLIYICGGVDSCQANSEHPSDFGIWVPLHVAVFDDETSNSAP